MKKKVLYLKKKKIIEKIGIFHETDPDPDQSFGVNLEGKLENLDVKKVKN